MFGPTSPIIGSPWVTPPKKQFLSAEIPKSDHKLSKTFILSNYNMFWLRYCLSILCGAFLLKSVISSHNSCGEILFRCFCGTWRGFGRGCIGLQITFLGCHEEVWNQKNLYGFSTWSGIGTVRLQSIVWFVSADCPNLEFQNLIF